MARASDQSKTGFVTVATVRSHGEAQAIAAKLKAAGIESLLSVERAASIPRPGNRWFGGTKVQVARADVEAALRALQRSRVEQNDPRDGARAATKRAAARPMIDLDNWRGAALAVAAMVTLAVLLALWLF